MDRRIAFLKDKFLDNLQHQWTVEESARMVNLSASHLQKLFKQEVQISPIAFLHDLRLEKSRELLETTFDKLYQIRYEVGIRNESHFTHDFKRKFGVTPTQYRKQYWDKMENEKPFCQE